MGNKTKIGIILEMSGMGAYILGALILLIGLFAAWSKVKDYADTGVGDWADAAGILITVLLAFCGLLVVGFLLILAGLIMQVITAKEFNNYGLAIAGLAGFVLGFILSISGSFFNPVVSAIGGLLMFVSLGLPLLKIGGMIPAIIGMVIGSIAQIASLVLSMSADVDNPDEVMNYLYANMATGIGQFLGYGMLIIGCIMAIKWTGEHYIKKQ